MMIPGLLGIPVAFCYMLSSQYWVIVIGYVVQGALLGGGAGALVPSYMNERFPTEIRATASAFCYHLGTIFGGLVPPTVTFFALNYNIGFSVPMLVGCLIGGSSWCLALFLSGDQRQGNGAGFGADLRQRRDRVPQAHVLGNLRSSPWPLDPAMVRSAISLACRSETGFLAPGADWPVWLWSRSMVPAVRLHTIKVISVITI